MIASPFVKGGLRGISALRLRSKINLVILNRVVFITG